MSRTEDEDVVDARPRPNQQVRTDEEGEERGHEEDAIHQQQAVPTGDILACLFTEA